MKSYLKSYWFWFYLAFIIMTVIDYIDHVTRPGQSFSKHKLDWFLFSFFSTLTLLSVIGITNKLTGKISDRNVILESLSIIVAILIHTYLAGPLYGKLFYKEGQLTFFVNFVILAVWLGSFYFIRIIVSRLNKRIQ